MADYQMGEGETRFAEIIWANEPISSSVLAKLAEGAMGWKKTTSFTVLRRLCDKGIFQNEKGSVTSLISREEFATAQSERFVADNFDGSLPAFLAAFSRSKRLSEREAERLLRLVAEFREDE